MSSGRPSKLDAKVKKLILDAISLGATKRQACQYAKIDESTLYDWLSKGKGQSRGLYYDFYQDYQRAEASPCIYALGVVQKAMREGDVRSAMWILEKKYGFGQTTPQVQISVTPENMTVTQLVREIEDVSSRIGVLSPPPIDLDEE